MREIRFRAWNKIKECFWGTLSSIVFEKGPQGIGVAGFMGGDGSIQDWGGEDLIFEQFTGLQDKNGVDIYEGDIVVWVWLSQQIQAIVKWDEKRAKFFAGDRCDSVLSAVEVIGNIHEEAKA